MHLENKVVIVTGAGNGIGAETARLYAEHGAKVILADWAEDQVSSVAQSIEKGHAEAHRLDVSNPESVDAFIKKVVDTHGQIDVLVNNAGIHIPGSILDSRLEDWKRISSVNIDGTIFCSKFALPHLLKSQGNIVNLASVSGLGADWGAAYYCVTKGAVVNLTRAMALDHGKDGVRVNAVCPSLVKTNMTNDWSEEIHSRFNERIPLARAANPREIAQVIVFLSSPLASFVNGANIPVDGGVTASNGQPKLF